MQAKQIKRDNYTVQIGYSREARKRKLMKFISKSGDEFVISAEEMAAMLVGGVNSETLEATFVDIEKIDVVEVGRQIQCVLDKDMKKGEKININYTHPYPLQFAIIEQVYGIASLEGVGEVRTLTKEQIDSIRAKIKPEHENFVKKFYKSFRNFSLEDKKITN